MPSDYVESLDEVYDMYSRFSYEVFEFVVTISEVNLGLKKYVVEHLSIPVTESILNPDH